MAMPHISTPRWVRSETRAWGGMDVLGLWSIFDDQPAERLAHFAAAMLFIGWQRWSDDGLASMRGRRLRAPIRWSHLVCRDDHNCGFRAARQHDVRTPQRSLRRLDRDPKEL